MSTLVLSDDALTRDDLLSMTNRVQYEAQNWCLSKTAPLVSPAVAVSALGELTPGGALMKGFQEESLARKFLSLVITNSMAYGIQRFNAAFTRALQ